MNSISVILHPKSDLGRALLAAQDPAEIITPVASTQEQAEWLEKHYPWFNILRLFDSQTSLPFTGGPVRIFNCRTLPQTSASQENQNCRSEMLADLSVLRRILQICNSCPVHMVFVSTASAESPAPLSLCANTIQSELEKISAHRPNTNLSIFFPGRLNNSISSTREFFSTSYPRLAKMMIKTAAKTISKRIVIGADARFEIYKSRMVKYFTVVRSPKTVIPERILQWNSTNSTSVFDKHAVEALQQ
jgi:hypothetical protein